MGEISTSAIVNLENKIGNVWYPQIYFKCEQKSVFKLTKGELLLKINYRCQYSENIKFITHEHIKNMKMNYKSHIENTGHNMSSGPNKTCSHTSASKCNVAKIHCRVKNNAMQTAE